MSKLDLFIKLTNPVVTLYCAAVVALEFVLMLPVVWLFSVWIG